MKISKQTKELIEQAKNVPLLLDGLIEKYGIEFIGKLLKSLIKPKKVTSSELVTEILYPDFISFLLLEDRIKYQEIFRKELKNAGFKIRTWPEDFIDEDTGDVVSIERNAIYWVTLETKAPA